MDEQEYAQRLADAILQDPEARAEVLAPVLLNDAFQRRLDAVARQVSGGLGGGFSVVSQGPGRAALLGSQPYGLFYDRDSQGRVSNVELYPLRLRKPPAWRRASWCVTLLLAGPLLLDAVVVAPTIVPRLLLGAAALVLTLALRTNSRWDVIGLRWRRWWLALMVVAAAATLIRGGSPGTFRLGSVESLVFLGILLVSAPTVLARRQSTVAGTVAITAPIGAAECGYVLQGGASAFLNHHFRHSEQRWALDIVPVGGRLLRNAFDRGAAGPVPVLAPVEGRVVRAADGQSDQPGPGEAVHPYGNHVVLEHDDGTGTVLLFLCHLAQGSVVVRAGQQVAAGQTLGAVGNSGRSTEPHLHLHAVRPGIGPVPVTVDGRQLWRGSLIQPAAAR